MHKLEPFRNRSFEDFLQDTYLRDIVERNLEVAAQHCIDSANRIISVEGALKPTDYYQSFVCFGEIGGLPIEFAQRFASTAGFRNLLMHEYLAADWNEVYANLQDLDELYTFAESIRQRLANR